MYSKVPTVIVLMVEVLLLCTVAAATLCSFEQSTTCLAKGNLALADVYCLASNPVACSSSICDATKWKAALACTEELGCSVGSYLEPERCSASFVVCDAAFMEEFCGVTGTPAPPPVFTIPPAKTGVNLTGGVSQPMRPETLKFGMAADGFLRLTGCHEVGGVDMAFNQINKNGGAAGTKLELVFDHIEHNVPDKVVTALHKQLLDDDVFAFSQTSYVAPSVYHGLAAPNGIPMINPMLGDAALESERNIISIHAQPMQSIFHFLKFAIHGYPMCTRFGIALLGIPEMLNFADVMDQHMSPFGYGKVVRVVMPYGNPGKFKDRIAMFDDLFSNDSHIPNCIVMMNYQETVPALRRHPKFDPTTHVFQTDYTVQHYQFIDPFEKHSDWYVDHLTIISFFPDPSHHTSRLARSYREALADHKFRDIQSRCGKTLSAQQFEAYTTGRFIAEIVSRMDPTNFTRQNFVDTVYKTGLFQIDDMKFGIFSDNCDGLTTEASGSCFCTFGGRRVFTRAIGHDGYLKAYNDNYSRGEFGIAELTIPAHMCTIVSAVLSVPVALRFACLGDSSSSLSLVPFFRQLLVGYNRHSQLQERMARMYLVPTEDYTGSNAPQNLSNRFAPAAFLDGDRPLPRDMLHIQVQPDANGALPLSIATANQEEVFNPNRVWLVSFLEDHVHALAAFAATSLKLEARTHVIGTSEAATSMGIHSVESFGHAALSTTTTASITATRRAAAGDGILVVAETAAAVGEAVQLATQTPSVFVLLACSEEHLEAVIKSGGALDGASRLFFATPFAKFWTSSSTFGSSVASLDATARSFVNLAPEASSVAKIRAGFALNILGASAVLRQTRMNELFEWLYVAGVREIGGVAYGPLSKESCSTSGDRLCECTKGLKKMHVYPVVDWAATSVRSGGGNQTSFHYTSTTCAPDYKPLPISSLSSEDVATVIAAVLAGIFAVIALIAATRKLRNTTAAPKDESKPFAMVFTDIQSSTTLWAECPVEMGEGVETHHTILRSLIKEHNGYEVKTIGDSFMVAFTSPMQATAFALDIQTTLFNYDWGTEVFDYVYRDKICDTTTIDDISPEDLEGQIDPKLWNGIRVRVGVHYGTGSIQKDEVTQGYDYYGTVVNTAARVESVGNGGQVLLTEAAYNAVFVDDDQHPKHLGSVDIKDMGPQPLRGLPHDVHLYQCTPASISARRYAPLRVESESPKEGHEELIVEKQPSSDSCSTLSLSEDEGLIRDALIARTVRRHWNSPEAQALAKQRLIEGLSFVNGILATAGSSYRKMFVKHVAAKWHIDMKNEHENTALVSVLARVLRGIETKERRIAAGGGDSLAGSGLRADSLAGSGRRPSTLALGSGSGVSVGSKVVSVGPINYPL